MAQNANKESCSILNWKKVQFNIEFSGDDGVNI